MAKTETYDIRLKVNDRPVSAKIAVPGDLGEPIELNQGGPLRMICGVTA